MSYQCVILLRNPVTKKVVGIADEFPGGSMGYITIFADHDEAEEFASQNKLCLAWPYQIVELDEL